MGRNKRATNSPREYWRNRIKIEPISGCWLWTSMLKPDGYGYWRRRDENRGRSAHAVIWEEQNGPIPTGMELDHRCRRRGCVNPGHLEPVTHAENCRRAAEARTHCQRGHAFSAANTIVDTSGGRRCRQCIKQRRAEYWQRKKLGLVRPPSTTHCRRGHAFSEANTIVEKSGARKCRTCYRAAQRRRYHEGRQRKP
jgi:hypothetical protein